MSSPNALQLQPPENWTINDPDGTGQYALADIFTGESLTGKHFDQQPRMPAALLEDPELAEGAEAWRTMRIGNVNIYLIDPNRPDGFGDLRTYKSDILSGHNVAGFAVQRSVLRAEQRRQNMQWNSMGQVAYEKPHEEFYMDLLDIQDRCGDQAFTFDLPVDGDNRPLTPAGLALAEARDITGFGAFDMQYPGMTDDFYRLDISYTNTLGWAQALYAGKQIHAALNGEDAEAILLDIPPEHLDIARKIGILAADRYGRPRNVTMMAAFPEYFDPKNAGYQQDYDHYGPAMQNGVALPRSMWR